MPIFNLKCRFFTYGNFPLEQHLKQIHEEALIKFDRIESNTDIPKQKLWEKPVSKNKKEINKKKWYTSNLEIAEHGYNRLIF